MIHRTVFAVQIDLAFPPKVSALLSKDHRPHRGATVIPRVLTTLLLATLVLSVGPTASCQDATDPNTSAETTSTTQQSAVDVRTQIWPLLQRHCLRCHNAMQSDGDLRLDRIHHIRAGGHTGNTILGTVDDSELLRRLRSTDPGYRMPKDADPLSAEQIDLFTRWIAQGSPWPDNESAVAGGALAEQALTVIDTPGASPIDTSPANRSWSDWFSERLDVVSEYQQPMRPLLIALLPVCLVILLIERRKRAVIAGETGESQDWASRIVWTHYVIVVMVFLWAATVVFYGVHQTRLQRRHDKLMSRLNQTFPWTGATASSNKPKGPFRPKHPPWMGGVYYRGNDERNEKLFNGGFYCTSKMYLSLRDRNSDALQWEDPIDSETLAVCLEIERSPFATPSLYNDETMTRCSLRLADPSQAKNVAAQRAAFQVLKPGERWRACYPLRGLAEQQGDVSRYQGGIDLCNSGGQPHYGIRYDIVVRDGRIDAASEIWMGATFLTSNVVVPQEGKIPLREWFDFVPIPEITHENSKDPDLLGITEHVEANDGHVKNQSHPPSGTDADRDDPNGQTTADPIPNTKDPDR
tara:strand:- start:506785 stop:508524 length:1740 start_codon:yes stop_codon:yes gene_type:complete